MSIKTAIKYQVIRAAFELLALPGVSNLVRAGSKCKGVIFTLHRVVPDAPADFSPNAILQITPQFLQVAIKQTRQLGFEIVDLDEALRRVRSNQDHKPFAVFTFDDAYRDNLTHALPVLRAHKCPFTLYVPTALVDGVGEVWWQALEDIIAQSDTLVLQDNGDTEYLECRSLRQKNSVFAIVYQKMREMPEDERVALIRDLAWRAGMDLDKHCRDLIMDWRELQTFVDEPLCTIGAHTVHHFELSKLTEERVRSEIDESIRILQAQLGVNATHLSYPIGSKIAAGQREYDIAGQLGLETGVTTIPGGLYSRHAALKTALPRISLNGYFQKKRFVNVLLTGGFFSRLSGK